MIYVIGSNSHVIYDFIKKNREEVIGVGRKISDYVDIFWDLSDHNLPDILKKKLHEDDNISIIYTAAHKSEKLFINESLESISLSLSINYLSYISILKYVLPLMIKNNSGKVIYLGSSYAEKNSIGASLYGSTKTAAIHLTESIAREYAKFGIQANTIMLGFFSGPLWNSIPERKKNEMLLRLPKKNLGSGQQLAELIEFLLIKSDYINGQKIYLDGAMS